MEDKNYRDDFELFLKESTDEFRMVPSRKVWYSIYNNMHPDRRWPSMAVCMLILSAVLYIGIENNNSLSNAARKNASENFTDNLNVYKPDKNITFLQPVMATSSNNKQQQTPIALIQPSITSAQTETIYASPQNSTTGFTSNVENLLTNIIIKENNDVATEFNNDKIKLSSNNKLRIVVRNNAVNENTNTETVTFQQEEKNTITPNETTSNKEIIALNKNDKDVILKNLLLETEKSWKEDYAFRNKPAINKLKQNGSISYYITPSLGYRNFTKKNRGKTVGASNNFIGRSLAGVDQLDDNAALNFEIGAAFQYTVSKNIRIKTGLQANYSNYTSNVTSLGHPAQIALAATNYNSVYGASNYSSTTGNMKLNKSSVQLAIPVGADVKLAGTGNLKWFVGATLQPTYLLKGSAYVLSSDAENYATEPGLLRKLNLNSAIETFISFKSSTGVTVTVGPQFRYQLFSTYKNEYNYSEKLYNIGVKLGISTTF